MADKDLLRLKNDTGVDVISIGVKEFKCMGATPPHDHPHVFLNMGAGDEIICPYCATIYRHDATLHADETRPADCLHHNAAA